MGGPATVGLPDTRKVSTSKGNGTNVSRYLRWPLQIVSSRWWRCHHNVLVALLPTRPQDARLTDRLMIGSCSAEVHPDRCQHTQMLNVSVSDCAVRVWIVA